VVRDVKRRCVRSDGVVMVWRGGVVCFCMKWRGVVVWYGGGLWCGGVVWCGGMV